MKLYSIDYESRGSNVVTNLLHSIIFLAASINDVQLLNFKS